ncbi:glycosyltransferase family 2 protein [Aurantiacibacter zhengii]|uniref:Glycosyltransferase family 2 protein n=2 Tax=Aurantiacibacter zhengii TaxID=2307003 RepID=A0A418NNQ8_9SPHN|nr:glycosyltransferase family 2 protein [Aurantiacibacter zhengii]
MSKNRIDRQTADVTVIIVSFNTKDLTIKAVETLLRNAGDISMRIVIWDNASHDESAEAIRTRFPQVDLIASQENLGFAISNNRVAETVNTDWIVLLNPDTETHHGAIERLVSFGRENPQAGIVGGRTVFPDGSLNVASCWNRMTIWSMLCSATGLSAIFKNSNFFNPEGMGSFRRDEIRHADVIVGCFLAIRTRLWRELGGFSEKYTMYGEDADLCLRARRAGYRPMITPDAQIMHLVGASSTTRADKLLKLYRGKATLIKDHWSQLAAPIGIALLWTQMASRRFGYGVKQRIGGDSSAAETWRRVWKERREILRGYPDG